MGGYVKGGGGDLLQSGKLLSLLDHFGWDSLGNGPRDVVSF